MSFGVVRREITQISSARTYLLATLAAPQAVNIGIGDHVAFDAVDFQQGTMAALVLGRFRLQPGGLYRCSLCPVRADFSGPTGRLELSWHRLDTPANFGARAGLFPDTDASDRAVAGLAMGLIDLRFAGATTVDIEARITDAAALTALGNGDQLPWALVEEL